MNRTLSLSDRERRVAAAVQLRRSQDINGHARKAGVKAYQFVYALKRLQEKRVLRPWVLVNPFQLGFDEFELLFTIGASAQPLRHEFVAFLHAHAQVIWFGTLGGSYQYGVRIIARGPAGCRTFLDQLDKKFPALVARKSIVSILSFTTLPKRYLAPRQRELFAPAIEIRAHPQSAEVDAIDRDLLQALLDAPLSSERELARATGYARGTVHSRLRELSNRGILLGSIYLVSARALGYQAFRVLIFGRGLDAELDSRISHFVKSDSSVVNITRCLGEWDYELSIEVRDPLEIAAKVSALYEIGGPAVERIELVQVFEQDISHRFLSEWQNE